MRRWLILADDLTGAADCAVAFARRGHGAIVAWGSSTTMEEPVVAVDADSRRMPAEAAAARHAAMLHAWHQPGATLFKKIDSTLRGQPAAELAAALATLRGAGTPRLALVAPAFPATGRSTLEGRVWLEGAPLEASPLWVRDHTYGEAHLPGILADAGISCATLSLGGLRGGELPLSLMATLAAGREALVVDAGTEEDLARIAEASLPLADRLIWVGSGGLAHALAEAARPPHGALASPAPVPGTGGLLLVVGSLAEASRAAAARLEAEGGVRAFTVPPALLRGGEGAEWRALSAAVAESIASGQDTLACIAEEPGADLREGAELARRLAALLRPAALRMGGLFATGGETARALLSALGVNSLRMLEEIEPGVPLGLARGVPVVTKAGGFGHAGSIVLARQRLRAPPYGKRQE